MSSYRIKENKAEILLDGTNLQITKAPDRYIIMLPKGCTLHVLTNDPKNRIMFEISRGYNVSS